MRNWDVIRLDPKVRDLVADSPQITYRRARSLKDELIKSHYEPRPSRDPCIIKGSFPCGECPQCRFINNSLHLLTIHGINFGAKHFANFNIKGIIYLMICQCKAYYVGKTKREWRYRIAEHSADIRRRTENSPVAGNVKCHHGPDPSLVRFIALDRVHVNIRGGNWDQSILRTESKWIYRLKATKSPGGLNISNS